MCRGGAIWRAITARALARPPTRKHSTKRENTHGNRDFARFRSAAAALEQRDRARSLRTLLPALVGQERELVGTRDTRSARARARNLLSTRSGVCGTGEQQVTVTARAKTIGSCPRSSRFRHLASNGQPPIPYWVYAHATQSMRAAWCSPDGPVVTRRARARGLPPLATGRPGGHANGQIGRASVRDFGTVLQRAFTPRARAPGTAAASLRVLAALNSRFQTCVRAQRFRPPRLAAVRSLAETPHGDTRIGVTGGPLTSSQTCPSPQSPPPFRFSTASLIRSFLPSFKTTPTGDQSSSAPPPRTSSRCGSVFVVALRLSYTLSHAPIGERPPSLVRRLQEAGASSLWFAETTLSQAWSGNCIRGPQCAFEMSMFMCPAVHKLTRN